MRARIGIRWTVGNVSREGFEALHLSIWGAWQLFGTAADYLVCTNGIVPASARELTGKLPAEVIFQDHSAALPDFLAAFIDPGMAEGVAWKFAPLRAFPHHFELALDNDCILWNLPEAIHHWLQEPAKRCLLAEDVVPAFGQFAPVCGPQPRNSGIRGFPPEWDFEKALRQVLVENPVTMRSELDEQGLFTAAVSREQTPLVVSLEEVSICSPFPPHLTQLGRCGAHFCGINAKAIPWSHEGRPATECLRENWQRFRPDIQQRVERPL